MAELPREPVTPPTDLTRFPAVDLQIDLRDQRLRRLDAQAAVDRAREVNMVARHALVAASTTGVMAEGPVRLAADRASSALRAAVAVLVAHDATHGGHIPAALDVDVLVDVDRRTTTIRPHGEVDLLTSPRLEQVCLDQIDGPRLDRLVVDLSAVTFLDSSGLALLVQLHRVCVDNHTAFLVTGPDPRTRRLLTITRLDTVLDIE